MTQETAKQGLLNTPSEGDTGQLARLLEQLLEINANRYDPVRFGYLASMARRDSQHGGAVSSKIEQKALTGLQGYQLDFQQAQAEALALVEKAIERFPPAADTIKQLFHHCDFPALKRHLSHLERAAKKGRLGELSERLRGPSTAPEAARDQGHSAGLTELKALGQLRQTLGRARAEKLVRRAEQARTGDAGPLNPHNLVIRSLANMRDISPESLNRFVAYAETLLWLQQVSGPNTNRSGKKTRS